jgi:hypothetical protein
MIIVITNIIVLILYIILCQMSNIKIDIKIFACILIILNLLYYSFKKEKYSNLLIDLNPPYIDNILEANKRIEQSSSYRIDIPSYNSKNFCNNFPKYKTCSSTPSSNIISPLSFTFALLGSYYNNSIIKMIDNDYENINMNNSVTVGKLNKNDITPFIPNLNYTFNLDSISNNSFIPKENNNLGNYDTILSVIGEYIIENNIYNILNILNITIIDYIGNENSTSEYIELKRSFINNVSDTKFGTSADYNEGGDPDLLCINENEYGPNNPTSIPKIPIQTGLYYIKKNRENLFWDSNSLEVFNTNKYFVSFPTYFLIKFNINDNTYHIINYSNFYLYYNIEELRQFDFKYLIDTDIDKYKFNIRFSEGNFIINPVNSEAELVVLIGILNDSLYRNLPHNINVECENNTNIGRWVKSKNNCVNACLGVTKTEKVDGIQVGTCSDSEDMVLCSCCNFKNGYSSRVFLTNWLNNKIATLKNNILDPLVNLLTTQFNKYDSLDPHRIRFMNIFAITLSLIVNMYQEKTLVDNSNINGTYYKPWENIYVINEMRKTIQKYLPFLYQMVQYYKNFVAENMNIIFKVKAIPDENSLERKKCSNCVTCEIKYSLNLNGKEEFSPQTDEYQIDYYPVLRQQCTTDDFGIQQCTSNTIYEYIRANANDGFNPGNRTRVDFSNWFDLEVFDFKIEPTDSLGQDCIYMATLRVKKFNNYFDELIPTLSKKNANTNDGSFDGSFNINKSKYYSNTLFFHGKNYVYDDVFPRDLVSGIYNNIIYFHKLLTKNENLEILTPSFEYIGGLNLNESIFYSNPEIINNIIVPALDDTTKYIYPFGINAESWQYYIINQNMNYNCSDVVKIKPKDTDICKTTDGSQVIQNFANISSYINGETYGNLCCPTDSSGYVQIQTCHDPYGNFKYNNRTTYCVNNDIRNHIDMCLKSEFDEEGIITNTIYEPCKTTSTYVDIPNILINTVNNYLCSASTLDYYNRYYPSVNVDASMIIDNSAYFIRINESNNYLISDNLIYNRLYSTSLNNIYKKDYCTFISFSKVENFFIFGCTNISYPNNKNIINITDMSIISYIGFLYYDSYTNSIIINKTIKTLDQAMLYDECVFKVELNLDGSYNLGISNSNSLYWYINGNVRGNNKGSNFVFVHANFGNVPNNLIDVQTHYNKIGKWKGYYLKGDLCIDFLSSTYSPIDIISNFVAYKQIIKTFELNNKIYMMTLSNRSTMSMYVYDISSKTWSLSDNYSTHTIQDEYLFTIDGFISKNNIYIYSYDGSNISSYVFNTRNNTTNTSWSKLTLTLALPVADIELITLKYININDFKYVIVKETNGLSVKYIIDNNDILITDRKDYLEPQTETNNFSYKPWNSTVDNNYWSKVQNYSTIKYVNIDEYIYCIGFGINGIEIKNFNTKNYKWNVDLVPQSPFVTQEDIEKYYTTLMVHVINNAIYILYKLEFGLIVYKLNTLSNTWFVGNILTSVSDYNGIFISSKSEGCTTTCKKSTETPVDTTTIRSCVTDGLICVISVNLLFNNNSPVYNYYNINLNTWNNENTNQTKTLNNVLYPIWTKDQGLDNAYTIGIKSCTNNTLIIYMQPYAGQFDFYILKLNKKDKVIEIPEPEITPGLIITPEPYTLPIPILSYNIYSYIINLRTILIPKTGILSFININCKVLSTLSVNNYLYMLLKSSDNNSTILQYKFNINAPNINDENLYFGYKVEKGDTLIITCADNTILLHLNIKLWIENENNMQLYPSLSYPFNIPSDTQFLNIEGNKLNCVFNNGEYMDYNLNMIYLNNYIPNSNSIRSSNYISLPEIKVNKNITISFWIRSFSIMENNTCIISLSSNNEGFNIFIEKIDNSNYINFSYIDSTANYKLMEQSDINIVPYVLYNIVIQINYIGMCTIYINNINWVEKLLKPIFNINFINNYIGRNQNNTLYYNGNISNFLIYDYILSKYDLMNLYNNTDFPLIYLKSNYEYINNGSMGLDIGFEYVGVISRYIFDLELFYLEQSVTEETYIKISQFELSGEGIAFSLWFMLYNGEPSYDMCLMNLDNYIKICIQNDYVILSIDKLQQKSMYPICSGMLYNLVWNISIDGKWDLYINEKYNQLELIPLNNTSPSPIPSPIPSASPLPSPTPPANYEIAEIFQIIKYYPAKLRFIDNYLGKHNNINYTGYIGEFRIYDKSISLYNIAKIYNNTMPYIYLPFNIDNINYGYGYSLCELKNSATINEGIIYNENNSYAYDSDVYLRLNSSNRNYCEIDTFNIDNNGLTFLMWINNKCNSDKSTIMYFGNNYISTSYDYSISMNLTKNSPTEEYYLVEFIIKDNEGRVNSYITTSTIPQNIFTHITWTINPDGCWCVYINGDLKYTLQRIYPTITERNVNRLGIDSDTSAYTKYFNGNIADFRVYNKVLSHVEITDLIREAKTVFIPSL